MTCNKKMIGRVLYAIGIIGGVEGATMRDKFGRTLEIVTSVIALVVIIIGAHLMEKE